MFLKYEHNEKYEVHGHSLYIQPPQTKENYFRLTNLKNNFQNKQNIFYITVELNLAINMNST